MQPNELPNDPSIFEEVELEWGVFEMRDQRSPWKGTLLKAMESLSAAKSLVPEVSAWKGGRIYWLDNLAFSYIGITEDGRTFEIRTRSRL